MFIFYLYYNRMRIQNFKISNCVGVLNKTIGDWNIPFGKFTGVSYSRLEIHYVRFLLEKNLFAEKQGFKNNTVIRKYLESRI